MLNMYGYSTKFFIILLYCTNFLWHFYVQHLKVHKNPIVYFHIFIKFLFCFMSCRQPFGRHFHAPAKKNKEETSAPLRFFSLHTFIHTTWLQFHAHVSHAISFFCCPHRRHVVTQYGVDSLKNMEQLNKFAEIYMNPHTYVHGTRRRKNVRFDTWK